MNSLRELQEDFVVALMTNDISGIVDHIEAGNVAAGRRIRVYRNNVFTNLKNVLHSVYPVIARIVGEGFFQYAATEFIETRSSVSGDLHDFGRTFDGFLAEFPPAQGLTYLTDVARLEWACHTSYFAADSKHMDLDGLARVSPDRYPDLKFKIPPACRLLHSPFPIHRIWQVNQEGFKGDQTVDLDSGSARVLVRRPVHQPEIVSLAESDWRFLEAINSGVTLGSACEEVLGCSPEFDIGGTLRKLVEGEVLVDFSLTDQ